MMADIVRDKRAIEALRSGVPSRDAVSKLGSSQDEIEEKFNEVLALSAAGEALEGGGLLIKGDFGSGKSHLLEHLKHRALGARFVVSKIVVSKETPLHDHSKVFRAAIENATVPGKVGSAITSIAEGVWQTKGERFQELLTWVNDCSPAMLNEQFAATLHLFGDLHDSDAEFTDRIIGFWAGNPIMRGELKKKLRECGAGANYVFSKVTAQQLSLQRFRFAARLIKAAGYAGWILLIDEAELIGRYSILQRGKAYADIARWIDRCDIPPIDNITAVIAMTSDFDQAVIEDKNDLEKVPNRFRARQNADDDVIAARAEQGMRIIQTRGFRLERPKESQLNRAYERLKELHGQAYEWQPPELDLSQVQMATKSMREYVRSWINEWDFKRLDPEYVPDLEIEKIEMSYTENQELETGSESEVLDEDVLAP